MALAHAIMTALIDDDLSGYELSRDFEASMGFFWHASHQHCLLYTSPSPRDATLSRMPSSA